MSDVFKLPLEERIEIYEKRIPEIQKELIDAYNNHCFWKGRVMNFDEKYPYERLAELKYQELEIQLQCHFLWLKLWKKQREREKKTLVILI